MQLTPTVARGAFGLRAQFVLIRLASIKIVLYVITIKTISFSELHRSYEMLYFKHLFFYLYAWGIIIWVIFTSPERMVY